MKLSDKSSIILSDIEEKNRASSLEAAFKLTASRQMWLDDQKKLNSLIRPFESELRQFGCEVIYSHEAIGVINPFRLPKRVRFCDGKYSNFSIDRLNDSFGGIAIHIFWPYNGTLNPWLFWKGGCNEIFISRIALQESFFGQFRVRWPTGGPAIEIEYFDKSSHHKYWHNEKNNNVYSGYLNEKNQMLFPYMKGDVSQNIENILSLSMAVVKKRNSLS